MTWLAWRQHRFGLIGWVATTVVFAALATGAYAAIGHWAPMVRHCGLVPEYFFGHVSECSRAEAVIGRAQTVLGLFPVFVLVLPGIAGAFLGATMLPSEFTIGTQVLAWSQEVSRRRWLLSKVGVVVMWAALGALILTAASSWLAVNVSSGPEPALFGGFIPYGWGAFDVAWATPIGYTVFAVAFGILVGAVVKSPLAAMIISVAGTAIARLAVWNVRPYFLPPLQATAESVKLLASRGSAWVLPSAARCVDRGDAACIAAPTVAYQPIERLATFQGIEVAIFVLAAALCLLATDWIVRRRD